MCCTDETQIRFMQISNFVFSKAAVLLLCITNFITINPQDLYGQIALGLVMSMGVAYYYLMKYYVRMTVLMEASYERQIHTLHFGNKNRDAIISRLEAELAQLKKQAALTTV